MKKFNLVTRFMLFEIILLFLYEYVYDVCFGRDFRCEKHQFTSLSGFSWYSERSQESKWRWWRSSQMQPDVLNDFDEIQEEKHFIRDLGLGRVRWPEWCHVDRWTTTTSTSWTRKKFVIRCSSHNCTICAIVDCPHLLVRHCTQHSLLTSQQLSNKERTSQHKHTSLTSF